MVKLAPALFMLWALCACQSAGLAPAKTFEQKYAFALGVNTSILQATTQSVTSGALSSADAEAILKQSDTAKSVLVAAQTAYTSGNVTGANNQLAIALATLTALQQYLNTHGAH